MTLRLLKWAVIKAPEHNADRPGAEHNAQELSGDSAHTQSPLTNYRQETLVTKVFHSPWGHKFLQRTLLFMQKKMNIKDEKKVQKESLSASKSTSYGVVFFPENDSRMHWAEQLDNAKCWYRSSQEKLLSLENIF